MVCVGSVLIENVFATTLTGLPDVPYWRAGGDTLDVDCMVLVYDSIDVSARYKENGRIQNSGTRWWGRT
jgi:hypothetical protein